MQLLQEPPRPRPPRRYDPWRRWQLSPDWLPWGCRDWTPTQGACDRMMSDLGRFEMTKRADHDRQQRAAGPITYDEGTGDFALTMVDGRHINPNPVPR